MIGYCPSLKNNRSHCLRILTDRGTEFKGKMEHHEYELYLQIEGIDHSKTQVRRPQSNGNCERLHRTMQEEFYAVAFRKKMYLTLDEMQHDLDEWIKYYNNDRPHSGRYCFGKTPIETFRESIILAKQKLIGQPAPAA
jgi:transposase InsO family protein